MASTEELLNEKFEGVGPITAAAAESTTWWAAGHVMGIPIGLGIGKFINEQSPLGRKIHHYGEIKWLGGIKGKTAFLVSAAVAGSFLFSWLGAVAGAIAGRRNGAIAREQFDRMQQGVRELSDQNQALTAQVTMLEGQLSHTRQQHEEKPHHHEKKEAEHGKAHEAPSHVQKLHDTRHAPHASHQEAVAAQEPAAEMGR